MKKIILLISFCFFVSILTIINVSAVSWRDCQIEVNLVNQDPDPAIPGQEVKVLFQLIGTENKGCDEIAFKIFEEYPFSLSPRHEDRVILQTGTFTHDYKSYFTLPYTLRVHEDVLDDVEELKIGIGGKPCLDSYIITKFNITIKDVQTDFEVYVRDYNLQTNNVIFEILNIGDADADSLVFEIPEQDNITLKGRDSNIIGILDSNDYATTSFDAILNEGDLNFIIRYNDETDTRRITEIKTYFNPDLFEKEKEASIAASIYLLITAIIFLIIIYHMNKKYKKRLKLIEKRYNSK